MFDPTLKELPFTVIGDKNTPQEWVNAWLKLACVAGPLNMGLRQSQGNLVFRGRERTQKCYWLKS
jgi:hypothetical protein